MNENVDFSNLHKCKKGDILIPVKGNLYSLLNTELCDKKVHECDECGKKNLDKKGLFFICFKCRYDMCTDCFSNQFSGK
jgi:hypothetical protein